MFSSGSPHGKVLARGGLAGTIAALPFAGAQAADSAVGYRSLVSAIITKAARPMPHATETDRRNPGLARGALQVDGDLPGQITFTSNRNRGLRTQIHSGLERVVGSVPGPAGTG